MADMDTTFNDGGVQTITRAPSTYAASPGGFDPNFIRNLVLQMRARQTAPVLAAANTGGGGPIIERNNRGGPVKYAREQRFNTAPLESMDAMDPSKTHMQRMTDRTNQFRAAIGAPSGDTQQGNYNAGHESFLPAAANAAIGVRESGLQDPRTAGQKTADARRQLMAFADQRKG